MIGTSDWICILAGLNAFFMWLNVFFVCACQQWSIHICCTLASSHYCTLCFRYSIGSTNPIWILCLAQINGYGCYLHINGPVWSLCAMYFTAGLWFYMNIVWSNNALQKPNYEPDKYVINNNKAEFIFCLLKNCSK